MLLMQRHREIDKTGVGAMCAGEPGTESGQSIEASSKNPMSPKSRH